MRDLYNVPNTPYFLSHSVGCLPKVAEQALQQTYIQPWKQQGGDAWPLWLDTINHFHEQLARLLGGSADEYCAQSNLSSALTKLLTCLPRNDTRNVIVMHAHAFASMGFVAQALQPLGWKFKLIDASEPAHNINTWQNALTRDVAVCLITHAHSNTGVVSPVKDIASLCAKLGIFSCVDIAQSVGVLPINVNEWQADAVLGSCVKWLCGGPGAGFMWLSAKHLTQLNPIDVGWFSHKNPFEFDIENFEYAESAWRFMGGTPPVAPFVMAAASIKQVNEIGIDKVLAHNRALLNTVLHHVPSTLAQQVNLAHIGGTLCLSFSEEQARKLASTLSEHKMYFDQRGNSFRFSLHVYNTQEEARKLATLLMV